MKTTLVLISTLLAFTPSVLAHADDFEIGLNPTTNRIQVAYDPGLFPWQLPLSEWPDAVGFALDDPGFVSLEAEEAVPGVFEELNPGAITALKVLLVSSPEMKAWNPVGPGEPGFQIIGDSLWTIGAPHFDNHPVWHIDTAVPTYDSAHGPWGITFQLVDSAGIHLASEPVTVSFTPEPASLGAAALSALAFSRRHS
jgi:hypothetical protein